MMEAYEARDFAKHPLMFYYEVTRACDLVCRHCRASAQSCARPDELSPEESCALLRDVARFERRPTVVLTGGDPLKRKDLYDLIRYARSLDLEVALTPSATPLATESALQQAKDAGVRRLGISLDGADASTHDSFRGWKGSFRRTVDMLAIAERIGLSVQVNTSLTARNFTQLDAMAELLSRSHISMWSVFFLVPVGRGMSETRIAPVEYEQAFARLWHHSQVQPYAIKTTEAHHYRRWVLQHGGDSIARGISKAGGRASTVPTQGRRISAVGVRDGNGIMFVGHNGEIYPAGFLPVKCGRFPEDSVVETYQSHPDFQALRDPDRFGGKCGACEYRRVCGGSRSRAFGVSGDMLGEEPDCVYQPMSLRNEALRCG